MLSNGNNSAHDGDTEALKSDQHNQGTPTSQFVNKWLFCFTQGNTSFFQLRRAQRSLRVNADLTVSNHESHPLLPNRPNRMFLLPTGGGLVQPEPSHQGQSAELSFKSQFQPKVDSICTTSKTIQSDINRQRHHYPLVSPLLFHVQSPQ